MKKIFLIGIILINYIYAQDFTKIKEKLIKKGVQKNYVEKIFSLPELKEFKTYNKEILDFSKKPTNIEEHFKKYKNIYDLAESKYKINREIIAALLLKETKFDKNNLKFNPISLHSKTLRDSKSKVKIKNAEDALFNIVLNGYNLKFSSFDFQKLRCNKNGSIGLPQFSTNSLQFLISYNQESPNINKMEDAILSIANYGHEIMEWNKLIDWNKVENINSIKKAWNKYKTNNGWITLASTNHKDSFIKEPVLKEYALKIYKYNHSSEYVLSILDTAYRISKERSF